MHLAGALSSQHLEGIGGSTQLTVGFKDNQPCIMCDTEERRRKKQVEIRYHICCEPVASQG